MAHEDAAPEDRAATEAAPVGLGRITRVRLKNYKSIVSCDVELQPLTILVGPNGSGKSNFLDALSFVKQALVLGLDQALRMRGNVERILSAARSRGDDSFNIQLEFEFPSGESGRYEFSVGSASDGTALVSGEGLTLSGIAVPANSPKLYSDIDGGEPAPEQVEGAHLITRLRAPFFLARHSDSVTMRPTFDLLSSMVFYNPLPQVIRGLRLRDVEPRLVSEGVNVASMLRRMQQADPDLVWRITQYMSRVLPGLEKIQVDDLAGRDLLRVSLASEGEAAPRWFDADQLSDGTLRALAILVALFQHRLGGKSATSLVGIEEPENNLHPATGGAFANALIDAAYDGQVLVTTHSMSLLDGEEIDASCLRAVVMENGVTQIGPVDKVSRSLLREHLYTAGELLQQNQMHPELDGDVSEPSVGEPAPAGR